MIQKMIYFSFMFGVWLVHIGSMLPIFLLFMSLGQSLHLAMLVASVLTFLFIIVQRTFRGLHLINQLQKNI
jgi:Na+/citrate or Na+/malate symporter